MSPFLNVILVGRGKGGDNSSYYRKNHRLQAKATSNYRGPLHPNLSISTPISRRPPAIKSQRAHLIPVIWERSLLLLLKHELSNYKFPTQKLSTRKLFNLQTSDLQIFNLKTFMLQIFNSLTFMLQTFN